jgi:molybdopterin-containing oxidoreductase family iron-sulfur binding subunit
MHCSEPPCVEVCPTGASHVLEDGTVVVDYEACINCGSCITVCPYDARVVNKTRNNYFHSDEQAPYEAYGEQRVNVVEKCNFCYKRMEEDLLPACVVNCPGNARYFGDLEDSESDVAKRLAWGDAIQIDDTAFYYAPVTGMPESELPFAAETASAATTTDDGGDGKGGISPVAATVGVAAVAAVGAGIGIGVKKARKGTVEEDDNE